MSRNIKIYTLEMWKYKNGYPRCHVRLLNNLVRVFFGFRLGLGLFKLQIGVSVDETFNKVLTNPVHPLWVDPILDGPTMFVCRSRTGQEHDLEVSLSKKDTSDTILLGTANIRDKASGVACVTTRERVHLWLESCTPCYTWPFPSLHVLRETSFPHSSSLQRHNVSSCL
jgi:hypothetical protein